MNSLKSIKSYKTLLLCMLSVLLLTLSFPKGDLWFLAWVALIPFMIALDGKGTGESFRIGYFVGIMFFVGTLYWFVYVTTLGLIFLILYLAVYFGVFALCYRFFSRKTIYAKLFLLPSIWVVLEFLREYLFTGFSWVSLGHSQYKVLPLIQIADITGVRGISFLVVIVNVLVKEIIDYLPYRTNAKRKKAILVPSIITLSLLLISLGYGFYRLGQRSTFKVTKIAVIQANTAQKIKWDPEAWPGIMVEYLTLTREVVEQRPDLIIWPETSFPGYVWEAPELYEELKNYVAQAKIPLLLGLVTRDDGHYYNSAVLISGRGEVVKRHDKLHLVPFGEYVPFRKYFPWFANIVGIDDFTAGKEHTLFPVSYSGQHQREAQKNFSVLICFEDTLPKISRSFTRHGSNLLVNITNDAWFGDTKAPFIHMQASVFRTIENRRALVRAANTGVSCFIDSFGRISTKIQNSKGKATYVSGHAIYNVSLGDKKTFYTKYGDAFTFLCLGGILGGMVKKS